MPVVKCRCPLRCGIPVVLFTLAACVPPASTPPSTSTIGQPDVPFRDRGVEAISLAARLVNRNSANAPLALLAAAQLLIDASPSPLGVTRTVSGDTARAAAKPQRVAFEAGSLIDAAEAMGRDNPNVVALAAQLRQRAQAAGRGAIGGPRIDQDRLPAGGIVFYETPYKGGQPAQLGLIGDGDTDIDCRVFDSAGNLIAQDIRRYDVCEITWLPQKDESFRIALYNLSKRTSNVYILGTN